MFGPVGVPVVGVVVATVRGSKYGRRLRQVRGGVDPWERGNDLQF